MGQVDAAELSPALSLSLSRDLFPCPSRALSAAGSFPADVTPVVVPVSAGDIRVKSKPGDLHVVNRRRLRRWLRRRPEVLDDGASAAVYAAAR
jgi:hypothetical protein